MFDAPHGILLLYRLEEGYTDIRKSHQGERIKGSDWKPCVGMLIQPHVDSGCFFILFLGREGLMKIQKMTFFATSKTLVVGLVAVATFLSSASLAVAQSIALDLVPVADTAIYLPGGGNSHALYHAIWAIDYRRRSMVKFEFPENFSGSTVTKADFEMEIERVDDPNTYVALRRMTHDWVKVDFANNPCSPGGGATWYEWNCSNTLTDNLWPSSDPNDPNDPNSPDLIGGAFGATDPNLVIKMKSFRSDDSTRAGYSAPVETVELPIQAFADQNIGDYALWDIQELAQMWADGTANYGFMFYADADPNDPDPNLPGPGLSQAGFWSTRHKNNADHGVKAHPPTLYLQYTVPGGCDFDDSDSCGLADINKLMAQGDLTAGVAVGAGNKYDLDGNNIINEADITEWLMATGTENSFGSPLLRGDTDGLDNVSPAVRSVDITDFQNFLTGFTGAGSTWEVGNFNGDNKVDITDFTNHFLPNFAATGGGTYGPGQAIPEPSTVLLIGLGGLLLSFLLKWHPRR